MLKNLATKNSLFAVWCVVVLTCAATLATAQKNLPSAISITGEQRKQSYIKLLAGQRYLSALQASEANVRPALIAAARTEFQQAVDLNPNLSEGYAALAELLAITGGSATEIERFSNSAIRANPDNFASHRLLARIYTRRALPNKTGFDRETVAKAVSEWQSVIRLDARSAEAWAFLAFLYDRSNEREKQINALEKWSASAAPLEDRFFRVVTGKPSLAPEAAAAELGQALFKAGKYDQAAQLLARSLSNNPNDADALENLANAIDQATPAQARRIIELLQTANNSNANPVLLDLILAAQIRAGDIDVAARQLREISRKFAATDKQTAANVLSKLGAVYREADRLPDAIKTWEESLTLLDLDNQPVATDAEREFVARTIPQLANTYRINNEPDKARASIARLKVLLGDSDATAELRQVELLRALGDRETALQTVRAARKRFPDDAVLLRAEAETLGGLGRVDEAVTLLRSKIVNKTKEISVPQTLVNDFLARVAISNLYNQANRGQEAVTAANQALELAQTPPMSNLGLLTLASAQNTAGDFKAAEISLRAILKTDADNVTAANNLGYFLIERGERLPEAIDLIKSALNRQPNNASFLDSLGWAYFKLDQLPEAEKYLTDAARRNPDSTTIQDHLGDLYRRQGNSDKARTAWRNALNANPATTTAVKIRAKLNALKK